MVHARDIMAKAVVALPRDASLREALRVLGSHDVSGGPVCDPRGRLVGTVSKGDLADALVNERAGRFECVGDVMTTDVLRVGPDDTLDAVAKRMVFEGAHRAIVVDGEDSVLGVLTPLDVLRALSDVGGAERKAGGRSRFVAWPCGDE